MSKIRLLDTETINQIAAGEVVERPASAIKEMIENSIDSGATSITVEIKNGGISFMRITDNGCGIEGDDAEKAFLPHCTSKINSIGDLQSLYTMGFRGEALASIAAVSKVDVITKTRGAVEGTAISLEGGKITSKSETGCPEGTTIVVKDLFFNTPARMNFLKKDVTEASHISEVVGKMIMGNPKISFRYISNGREVMFSTGNGNLKDAVTAVYGRELAENCVPVKYDYEGIHIEGLAGTPYSSRANRNYQNFFVNGRYVKSKTVMFAAEQAYKTMLMVGKYPVVLLYISINSAKIDVNVHPSKMEIKFSNDNVVHSAVFWAVQNAILSSQKEKQVEIKEKSVEPIKSEYRPFKPQNEQKAEISFTKEDIMELFKAPSEPVKEQEPEQFEETAIIMEQPEVKFNVVGQIFDTYIIVECDGEMLLIDQHAAHERINYNQFVAQKKVTGQVLMFPETVSFSSVQSDLLMKNIDLIKNAGFEIEEFGNNSFIVRQAPTDIDSSIVQDALDEILDLIDQNKNTAEIYDKILFSLACKRAIKANHKLQPIEMQQLAERVLNDDSIRTCPHGRPIVVSFTQKFIEKEFKRIV